MAVQHFSVLDHEDAAQVLQYERSFFSAFVRVTSNRLVRRIWLWDHHKERVRTAIPYEDQLIYTWRNRQGDIITSLAVNLHPQKRQYAEFGFQYNGEERAAEIITLYTTPGAEKNTGHKGNINFMKGYCYKDLAERGYEILLATCAARPLKSYLRLGWELLDEAVIDNEARYFLKHPLR